jgi:hypothetical protein
MIDPAAAAPIIEQYKKHGWTLRRVLYSAPLSPAAVALLADVPAEASSIDGLWFSRRSQPGCEAWEFRRLSGSPFALVEVIEDGTDPADFETILKDIERRMSAAASGPSSH